MVRVARTPSSSIQVIGRAAALLDILARQRMPTSLAELSREVDLSKSTVYNILGTLASLGYVSIDESNRRYRLGPTLLRLGNAFVASIELHAMARPHMVRLASETAETVSLHVRFGDFRTCIDQVPSPQPIRRVVELGRPRPLYVGAVGLVFLAGFDDTDVSSYLKRTQLVPVTPTTTTDPEELTRRVAETRQRGYAVIVDESELGVTAIALPICDSEGRVAASLVVSGPSERWNKRVIGRALPTISARARILSSDMGWAEANAATPSAVPPVRRTARRPRAAPASRRIAGKA